MHVINCYLSGWSWDAHFLCYPMDLPCQILGPMRICVWGYDSSGCHLESECIHSFPSKCMYITNYVSCTCMQNWLRQVESFCIEKSVFQFHFFVKYNRLSFVQFPNFVNVIICCPVKFETKI